MVNIARKEGNDKKKLYNLVTKKFIRLTSI